MATDPGAPRPDIDRPDVAPAETPVPNDPGQPGAPEAPEDAPGQAPDYDMPDQGPVEMPSPLGD